MQNQVEDLGAEEIGETVHAHCVMNDIVVFLVIGDAGNQFCSHLKRR